MNIPYAARSKFTAPCQDAIAAQQAEMNAGRLVTVFLKPRGYSAKIIVTVHADNLAEFETNWSARDPTRFPARLKAAATALRNCGCWGSFNITHAEGVVSIHKAS